MTEAIKQWIDEQSRNEAIYEPKYGGKDHSGYDTMMKYEVNYERMDAYDNGLTKGIEIAEGGFTKWVAWNYLPNTQFDDIWFDKKDGTPFTTSQLIEKYLLTIENK